MMTFWIFCGIILVVAFIAIGLYNRLVGARNTTRTAWAQIDVQLKRRHDLIPNLVEIVKDSMGYEQETLQQVIAARSKAMNAQTHSDTIAAEGMLSGAMGKLFAVMEAYPTLKALDNVAKLMEELASTENKIGFARQYYNDSVLSYNNALEMFPSNIFANMFHFKAEPLFTVTEESERAVPSVNLR